MRIRKLRLDDAPLMLEWMHDKDVVSNLKTNFMAKTILDCEQFIEHSKNMEKDINLAIVNDKDTYMGTVSLKHVNKETGTAEFAITIRKYAMGKGYSRYGMAEILKYGIKEIKLNSIYWCVNKVNVCAVKFYKKNGYISTTDVPNCILQYYNEEELSEMYWYVFS